jgi:hypothetical protein
MPLARARCALVPQQQHDLWQPIIRYAVFPHLGVLVCYLSAAPTSSPKNATLNLELGDATMICKRGPPSSTQLVSHPLIWAMEHGHSNDCATLADKGSSIVHPENARLCQDCDVELRSHAPQSADGSALLLSGTTCCQGVQLELHLAIHEFLGHVQAG